MERSVWSALASSSASRSSDTTPSNLSVRDAFCRRFQLTIRSCSYSSTLASIDARSFWSKSFDIFTSYRKELISVFNCTIEAVDSSEARFAFACKSLIAVCFFSKSNALSRSFSSSSDILAFSWFSLSNLLASCASIDFVEVDSSDRAASNSNFKMRSVLVVSKSCASRSSNWLDLSSNSTTWFWSSSICASLPCTIVFNFTSFSSVVRCCNSNLFWYSLTEVEESVARTCNFSCCWVITSCFAWSVVSKSRSLVSACTNCFCMVANEFIFSVRSESKSAIAWSSEAFKLDISRFRCSSDCVLAAIVCCSLTMSSAVWCNFFCCCFNNSPLVNNSARSLSNCSFSFFTSERNWSTSFCNSLLVVDDSSAIRRNWSSNSSMVSRFSFKLASLARYLPCNTAKSTLVCSSADTCRVLSAINSALASRQASSASFIRWSIDSPLADAIESIPSNLDTRLDFSFRFSCNCEIVDVISSSSRFSWSFSDIISFRRHLASSLCASVAVISLLVDNSKRSFRSSIASFFCFKMASAPRSFPSKTAKSSRSTESDSSLRRRNCSMLRFDSSTLPCNSDIRNSNMVFVSTNSVSVRSKSHRNFTSPDRICFNCSDTSCSRWNTTLVCSFFNWWIVWVCCRSTSTNWVDNSWIRSLLVVRSRINRSDFSVHRAISLSRTTSRRSRSCRSLIVSSLVGNPSSSFRSVDRSCCTWLYSSCSWDNFSSMMDNACWCSRTNACFSWTYNSNEFWWSRVFCSISFWCRSFWCVNCSCNACNRRSYSSTLVVWDCTISCNRRFSLFSYASLSSTNLSRYSVCTASNRSVISFINWACSIHWALTCCNSTFRSSIWSWTLSRPISDLVHLAACNDNSSCKDATCTS